MADQTQRPGKIARRVLRGSAILAATALLAGCSLSQLPNSNERANLRIAERWAAYREHQPSMVDSGWIASFRDAQLTAFVDEAIASNRDLRVAAARLEEANLRAIRAGADLVPTVTGSLRGAELDGVNGDAVSLGLDLSWEADVWGRIRSAETASILDAVAENAAFEGTRLSLAGAVAEAWFTVNGNAELVFVNASEVRTQRSALNFVVQQVEAGQALSVDANIARANVATSEARLADSQSDLQNSIRALEVLLGRYPSAQLRPRGGVGGLPGRVPVGLPAQLLERRPDVIEAERRLAAAYYRTESARAARLPTISINADASSGGSSLSDVLDGSNVVSSLIAGIAGPIFDGQGRATDERIANARQTQALELYAATALTAFREVEDALSSEQALARQAGALSRAVNQLRQALDVEQQRYEAGEIGIDRVDDARLRFFNARRDLVNVRVAQLRQRVQLHLALGGSFEDAPATETVVAAAAEG